MSNADWAADWTRRLVENAAGRGWEKKAKERNVVLAQQMAATMAGMTAPRPPSGQYLSNDNQGSSSMSPSPSDISPVSPICPMKTMEMPRRPSRGSRRTTPDTDPLGGFNPNTFAADPLGGFNPNAFASPPLRCGPLSYALLQKWPLVTVKKR